MKRSIQALLIGLSILLSLGAMAAPSCPQRDKSFKTFLAHFTDEVSFQRKRLILPLVSRSSDYMMNQAITLWALSDIEQLKYPLIYSAQQRKAENLSQKILLLTNRYAEVYQENVGESDSVRILYMFRNIDGCWFLESLHDKSL